ncbi:hypothetical protein ElyMa_004757300, partial [Elysia marginata]
DLKRAVTNYSTYSKVARNSATRGVTREKTSAPTRIARSVDRSLKKTSNRYGTESDLNIDSIDPIWSVPKDLCHAGGRAGGTSPPRPNPHQQSSPSQQPLRAPVPEESDSGDMDTDLGSALSADPSSQQHTTLNHLSTQDTAQRFCGEPGKTLDSAELNRAEGGRNAGGMTKTDGPMRQPPDKGSKSWLKTKLLNFQRRLML